MRIKRFVISLCLLLSIGAPVADAQVLWTLYKLVEGGSKVYQAATISDADLAKYMRQSMQQMDRQHKVCASDSKYTQRLQRITRGMTTINGLKLNFKVYYDPNTANAFASPDGSIRVFSKLMDLMTDDELLGIIGHELGHLSARHSLKAYREALLVSAARDGLMLSDGTIGQLAYSSLSDLGEYMINAHYSRTQEKEADRYGYDYLKRCGRNPCAMVAAFVKLRDASSRPQGKTERYLLELFSDHPDLETRIATLSERARKDGYTCRVCR